MPESQKSLPADAQQPGYPIIKDANGDNKITIDDVKMRNTLPKIQDVYKRQRLALLF